MRQESQPDYPLLYSLAGFRYCDLLLAAPERAAWQRMFWTAGGPRPQHAARSPSVDESPGQLAIEAAATGDRSRSELLVACRAVSQRAAQTLKWEEGMRGAPLLDFALHHLTLGRTALYKAILDSRSRRRQSAQTPAAPEFNQRGLTSAATELNAAVAGLRRAGMQDHLPRGILPRAWVRFLFGACTGAESAQADLDEAWEIAERGPMRLFLANILLTRARLFGAASPLTPSLSPSDGERVVADRVRGIAYPWKSPEADLQAAEKLIKACGYHRRDEELADAKNALSP